MVEFLSANELEALRDTVAGLLPDTATIYSPTTTTDDSGRWVESYAASATALCRLDPYQRQDSRGMVGDAERQRTWYRLTLPYNADVSSGSRIQIDGLDYEIVQAHDQHSARIVTRLIIARIG